MPADDIGTVYLLHFSRAYKHAMHYLGFTNDLEKRLARHSRGEGARLISIIVDAGITYEVVKTWVNVTRTFERKLKRRGGAARICPICRATKPKGETVETPQHNQGIKRTDTGDNTL